jgi:hypothetical protein
VEDGATGILCEPVSVAPLVTALQQASKLDLKAAGQRGHARFRQLYDIEMTHRALNRVYLERGSNVRDRTEGQGSPAIELVKHPES